MEKIMPKKLGVFHIVGIGGIGMSAIAKIMLNMGYNVQGSNLDANFNTKSLQKLGINVFIGHSENNVQNINCLIISSIILSDNVEVRYAKKNQIPVLKKGDILSHLTKGKDVISISGSHGKTTTSALLTYILKQADLSHISLVGGIMNGEQTNVNMLGQGKHFILESDESDGTFNMVRNHSVVVTNIDREHLEYFHSYQDLLNGFKKFIAQKDSKGFALVCIDSPGVIQILQELSCEKIKKYNIISYGITNLEADIVAYNIRYFDYYSIFDIKSNSDILPINVRDIKIPLPGAHNVLNGLAAIISALKMDITINSLILENFKGVKRRFNKILEYKESIIIDDYAHHPTEVKAILKTARNISDKNSGRVILFFQPHKISRVKELFQEFVESLSKADIVFITEIFDVGESLLSSKSSRDLVKYIKKINSNCFFLEDMQQIPDFIKSYYQKHDIFIIMGAGDISCMRDMIEHKLYQY
ncbi:MAG: UDP-N-acetylmuramate--L-alanine ligase [Rickettsia sp.]|nr:UDP-N-acetylmuramate--L-alanine ligase [Rickettsia sp.]